MHQASGGTVRDCVNAENAKDNQWNVDDDQEHTDETGNRALIEEPIPRTRQHDEHRRPEPGGDLEELRALDEVDVSDSCQLSAISYQVFVSRFSLW
ncbi:MAG TPA: hypothetical protein VKB63_03660 [Gemmatimonadales bacterium]|nr:hypothetical protein [Gemmatimonadales bacterium]